MFSLQLFLPPPLNPSMQGRCLSVISAQWGSSPARQKHEGGGRKAGHLQVNDSSGLIPDKLFRPSAEALGVQVLGLTCQGC